jgi:phosphoglycerate dehydrogenase-like enzyme
VNKPDGLLGAVLDVTDPEPLPTGHALFSHPRVIITPHTSGSVENYYDHGASVLLAQQSAIKKGEAFINIVDTQKGY